MSPFPTQTHLYVALVFMLANKESLIWDMKIRGSLDYNEHKMVQNRITAWTLGFCSYMSSIRKLRGKVHLVLNGAGGLMERAWKRPRYLVPISPHFLLMIPAIWNCRSLRLEGKSGP